MRLSAMGDVAMTVPIIASFLSTYPDVHITMLSTPKLKPLFPTTENFTFIPVDTKKEYAGNLGMYKLFKHLQKSYHFDAMLDLHDVLRSKMLRTLYKLKGTPVYVIEKGRKEKKQLTNEKNKQLKPLKSSIQRYADVFEKAGYPITIDTSIVPYQATTTQCTDELIQLLPSSAKHIIGIAPFAQHKGKIYPTEKTEKIIAHFAQQQGIQILLFGGGEIEKAQLEKWASTYPNTQSVAGKFSLSEELILLQHCHVVLSMDSSNMHLASLVHTPVVSIWGATHPYAGFYGYGQKEENAVQIDLPCRPCSIYGNKPCSKGDYPCLNKIEEEAVIRKIEAVLLTSHTN
ncbi:MAG: glycosyltransferase family 9 protein [Paludibacteraceae bacterium]|nr:glycosyltransferase family 9 protein [Paludibacteraceae bacterium]